MFSNSWRNHSQCLHVSMCVFVHFLPCERILTEFCVSSNFFDDFIWVRIQAIGSHGHLSCIATLEHVKLWHILAIWFHFSKSLRVTDQTKKNWKKMCPALPVAKLCCGWDKQIIYYVATIISKTSSTVDNDTDTNTDDRWTIHERNSHHGRWTMLAKKL